MDNAMSINENSQELEEGEIHDDITTESVVNSITSSDARPISELDKQLFGFADVDLRKADGRRSNPKTKDMVRLKNNPTFFRKVPQHRTHGNVTSRPQNSTKVQKFRKHRNAPHPPERTRNCSISRMDNRRNQRSKSKFRTSTRYVHRQQRNNSTRNLPQGGRKTHQKPHMPKMNFNPLSNPYASSAGQPSSLNSVDQEASYEDLLDQYKLIKLELGRLKKEEAKLTEQEYEKGSKGSIESRHKHSSEATIGKGIGNDKENKHQKQRHSRSPSKGKAKANRSDSVLHAKNHKLGNQISPIRVESLKEDVTGKEAPSSSYEEEEDEMELRRMALASRNTVNNKSDSSDTGYVKRRVSRENSNQKINSHNMDNYESVDMDLDSDCMAQTTDISDVEMGTNDNSQENMDDQEELLLREQLLRSLERRKNINQVQIACSRVHSAIPETFSPIHTQIVSRGLNEFSQNSAQRQLTGQETISSNAVHSLPRLPLPSLVINIAQDSSSDESDDEIASDSPPKGSLLDGLDSLLREARLKTEVPVAGQVSTPAAVSKLSKAQQLEYRKLKAEIAKRELHQPKVIPGTQPLQDVPAQQGTISEDLALKEQKIQLEGCEQSLKNERLSLVKGKERLGMLQQLLAKRKRLVDLDTKRLDKLRQEMAAVEASLSKNNSLMMKINNLVQGARSSVSRHILTLPKLERECNRLGKLAHGPPYKLPPSATVATTASKTFAAKRRVSLTSTTQLADTKKQKLEGDMTVTVPNFHLQPVRSSAELLAEKVRLQRLEQDIAKRLEELRMRSNAGSPKPQSKKTENIPGKLSVSNQISLKQIQEMLHLNSMKKTEKEAKNEKLETFDCKDQLRNIHLLAVYNIEQEMNTKSCSYNECEHKGDYLRLHCKTGLKMHNLEPTYLPLELSSSFSSFHSCPDSASEMSFSPSRLKEKALTNNCTKEHVGLNRYISGLLHFSSYRFNPRFKSENGQSLSCNAFTSKVNAKVQLCKYDLTGTCNDDQCKWQHSQDYICSLADIVVDLLSFCPEIAGVTPVDNRETSQRKLYQYTNCLIKDNSVDPETIMENVLKEVCSRSCIIPPHYIQFYKRNQKHKVLASTASNEQEESCKDTKTGTSIISGRAAQYPEQDSFVDPETDVRYFEPEKGFNGLEDYLLQNPNDTRLWLKLASHCMNSANGGLESLNRALDVLSRALETNRQDTELWQRYLTLFSGHPDSKDILSLCQQALEFTKHYSIWWKYLELSEGFLSKSQICKDLLSHLLSEEDGILNSNPSELSHQLLETFLYLIQLCVQTGRLKTAIAFYKRLLAIDNSEEYSVLEEEWSLLSKVLPELSCSDAVLAWLCFLHLVVYSCLPSCLFQNGSNQPTILAHKEPFVIMWPKEFKADDSMISLLIQAIHHFTNVATSINCWPLHQSLLDLYIHSGRLELAIEHCTNLCKSLPELLQTWIFLASLYLKENCSEKSEKVLQEALNVLPTSPQLCNFLATHYFERGIKDKAAYILTECVKPLIGMQCFEEDITGLIYKLLLNHHYGEDIPLSLLEKQNTVTFTEEETTYLWLNYALFLECAQALSATIVDVFESAIVSIKQQSNVELIWWRYLQYGTRCNNCERFFLQDLVFQCLRRMPVIQPLAHWPGRSRLNYRFHNLVIKLYCHVLNTLEDKIAFCQHLLPEMPKNEGLLHRLALLTLEGEGSQEALEFLAGHLLGGKMPSFTLWRMAISLAYKEKDFNEVLKLYHKALQVIPYTRCLWLDLLLLEGPEKEKIEPLLVRCRQLGILRVENSTVEEELLVDQIITPPCGQQST